MDNRFRPRSPKSGSTKGAPSLVSPQPCSRRSGRLVNLERRNHPDLLCYWGARGQRRYFPMAPPHNTTVAPTHNTVANSQCLHEYALAMWGGFQGRK